MSTDRVIVPIVLTGVVIGLAQEWPQMFWAWVYAHVHYNITSAEFSSKAPST